MDAFAQLYEQYCLLKNNLQDDQAGLMTNLKQYGITKDYYEKIDQATELLYKFCDVKLTNATIRNAVANRLNDSHTENVKFCVLVDVLRCYDGLDHPTSFTTPEGIALMVLLGKILDVGRIISYEQLEMVDTTTLSLIDIIPYINECSDVLGQKYSLFMSTIFKKKAPNMDFIYRRLLYNLCKRIAEVDGEITLSEQEWLNEITLLNDDDPDNDIDISGL